jgi:transcriptional regulator with XRE-family HTH domain
MPKPSDRVASRYALEALLLLGQRIRAARIERKLTMDETSTRAGISRALLRRIENGDPGSAIGSAFEVAAVVGVSLFEPDRNRLTSQLHHATERLALLPATARIGSRTVKDDF